MSGRSATLWSARWFLVTGASACFIGGVTLVIAGIINIVHLHDGRLPVGK